MTGADVLFHTALPFPMAQPKDEAQLIRPAIDGTVRAMRAMRAPRDFSETQTSTIGLTTINPSLALGVPLARHYGGSVRLIERLLRGKDPMVPNICISVVDLRDVAEAHLRTRPRRQHSRHRRFPDIPEDRLSARDLCGKDRPCCDLYCS